MRLRIFPILILLTAFFMQSPAKAFEHSPVPTLAEIRQLMAQLQADRQEIEAQRRALEAQRVRLEALEDRLLARLRATGVGDTSVSGGGPGNTQIASAQPSSSPQPGNGVETVGPRPAEADRQPEVAVLADQGGVITRAGQMTLEADLEYARADRNRFVFRGIEVPQSVLVGVFDINESRQDILTAALYARLGLTNRLEVSARVPWVYRKDASVLVPLVQNPPQSGVGTVNSSADGSGIGDVEFMVRYQLTDGSGVTPFLIAGLQAIAPTGKSPFHIPRDALGNAVKAPTGAGFWGVAPSLTVLMPTDPATILASLGYTHNFRRNVNTRISDAQIDRVSPGGTINMTAGLGIALNQQMSVSFAYAHGWSLATKTRLRPISVSNGVETLGDAVTARSRQLQLGRFLFGISYRVSPKTTVNWTVEMGATDDAPDVRTTLRIPFSFNVF